MFFVLTEAMESGLPPSVNAILDYAASPGVIIPIFLLLLMTIYYLVSVGRSLRESNSQLRMQLEYERTEGRRKVYAMAEAKRETEGDGKKGSEAGLKAKGKKRHLTHAVSSVLAASRLAKIMSAGQAKLKGNSVSPDQERQHIPVAVVQGKRSLKEKVNKEKLIREAFRRRDRKQGVQNEGYDATGDEEDAVPRHGVTNGALLAMMTKAAAQSRRQRLKRQSPEIVQQNIELDEEESSDDEEVVIRQSRSLETRPKPSAEKLIPSKHGKENLLAKPKERRSRSSSKEKRGQGRSTSNTSVEVINETVQAEVNICPPSNVKKSNSKTRQSRSRDNIQSIQPSVATDNFSPNPRNNLSAKRNITKSIPKITVEDCSDDNASVTDVKVSVSVDQDSESESTESSEDNDEHNDNLNVSSGGQNTSENTSVDDREAPRRNFASLLSHFQESESEGASSDDQNSPDAIASRNRFASALARFKKH